MNQMLISTQGTLCQAGLCCLARVAIPQLEQANVFQINASPSGTFGGN